MLHVEDDHEVGALDDAVAHRGLPVRRVKSVGGHAEGHAHTRTTTVAAVYGALVTRSAPLEARDRVVAVLPSARPRQSFVRDLATMQLVSPG